MDGCIFRQNIQRKIKHTCSSYANSPHRLAKGKRRLFLSLCLSVCDRTGRVWEEGGTSAGCSVGLPLEHLQLLPVPQILLSVISHAFSE